MSATDPIQFLTHYGYLPHDDDEQVIALRAYGTPRTSLALRMFQERYDLPVTGEPDAATLAFMAQPRCGLPDIYPSSALAAIGAIPVYGVWGRKTLHYFVESVDEGERTIASWLEIFAQQTHAWANICGIAFQRVSTKAEAEIVINAKEIGLPYGPNTLATGAPPIGLDYGGPGSNYYQLTMDINSLKLWDDLTMTLSVTLHEFGHNMGFMHSTDPADVMYPQSLGVIVPSAGDIAVAVQSYGLPNGGPVMADSWVKVASEGQSFVLAAPDKVRFGAAGKYTTKDLPAGMHKCEIKTFGTDPAFLTVKVCEVLRSDSTPTPPPVDPTVEALKAENAALKAKAAQIHELSKP